MVFTSWNRDDDIHQRIKQINSNDYFDKYNEGETREKNETW